MKALDIIYGKARQKKRRVVLPEGYDERVIRAALQVVELNIAQPVLLGEPQRIIAQAEKIGLKIEEEKIKIIDFMKDSKRKFFINKFIDIFHGKITREEAEKQFTNSLYFGSMMVAEDEAEGMVAGAANTTADVFRAAFHIIEPAKKTSTVSSFFLMIVPDCSYGEGGVFLFADGGIIPDPSPVQLANLAIETAKNMSLLLDYEPKVAMLSFSTKSSAEHKAVEKIQKATQLARKKAPNLIIDGELQVDAAIIPEIGERKAPHSPVKGKANILIFPDLDAGNIAYKLVERLAKAEAYGPILQGLAKPVSDLSRGCSVKDILNCTAIVAASA